jgi:hypothetical protein
LGIDVNEGGQPLGLQAVVDRLFMACVDGAELPILDMETTHSLKVSAQATISQ